MAPRKTSQSIEIEGRQLEVTNLDKVLFPNDGITKGEVIDYYVRIAPWLLPFIADRPMSMHPFPDGIHAQRHFWQKDIPEYAPDWLRTFRWEALEDKKILRWGLINDLPSLVWVANHASLELHPWSSRYDRPEYPDWAIFDFDPSEPAGFEEVRQLAKLVKVALDQLGLRSYIKTTGQRGLQIYVPIVREHPYEVVREWVHSIALLIRDVRPDIVTEEWDTRRRAGKVRIDYTQMVIGKTLVAPYAIRPKDGAPVSTPIRWEELDDPGLRPDGWNIRTVFGRLSSVGDVWDGVLGFDQVLPFERPPGGSGPAARGAVAYARLSPSSELKAPLSGRPSTSRPSSGGDRSELPLPSKEGGRGDGEEPPLTPSPASPQADQPLGEYNRKRDFTKTAEPPGQVAEPAAALRFCVQKHAATRLHYDFRLEKDGVLLSWAVPKGPSLNPADKRLAMHVEDHPIEYMTFEGTIPKGEYGGGAVMLWDIGTYYELPGSKDGDIKFVLHGQKLGGEFALVKMRTGEPNSWLLLKKHDEFEGREVDDAHSVKSGRTMEDIAAGRDAVWFSDLPAEAAEVDYSRAPEAPMPRSLEPMMASLADKPFSHDDWLFEVKWDGIRALAFMDNTGVRLMTRRGNDCTAQYPELSHITSEVSARQAILDGEIVAFDERGVPSFHLLQQRMNLQHETDIRRAQAELPVGYQLFDLLYLDGRDLRQLPLVQRKALLKRIVQPKGFVFYSDHVEGKGQAFYEAVVAQGLEGVVAKKKRSGYQAGRRTRDWLKLKATSEVDCVIGGWTEGTGNRSKSLGSLVLGLYDKAGALRYVTNAGSGFDERSLAHVCGLLDGVATDRNPFDRKPDPPGVYHWVHPRYVCVVKYSNWTPDGHLRHPIFQGMRSDKAPEDCTFEDQVPATAIIDR